MELGKGRVVGLALFEGKVAQIHLELKRFGEVLVFCFFLCWEGWCKGGELLLWFFLGIFK